MDKWIRLDKPDEIRQQTNKDNQASVSVFPYFYSVFSFLSFLFISYIFAESVQDWLYHEDKKMIAFLTKKYKEMLLVSIIISNRNKQADSCYFII